jgi:hypothetical protein
MLARYLGSTHRYRAPSVLTGAVQRTPRSFRSVACVQCLSEQVRWRPSRGTMFLHVSRAHELSKTSSSDDGFRRLKTKEQNGFFPSLELYLACQKPTWPRMPRMAVHPTPQKLKDYPKKTPRVLIVEYSLNYNHV